MRDRTARLPSLKTEFRDDVQRNVFPRRSRLQALQYQDMDTQQRHWKIAASAVGRTRGEIAMRDQQQQPDQKILGGRALHHGKSEWNRIRCVYLNLKFRLTSYKTEHTLM